MFDVAILGAGPAGASTAIRLAGFGFTVALFDKGEGRRQHVGESLPSSIHAVFETLKLELPEAVVAPRPPEHFVYWGRMAGGGAKEGRESSLLVWRGPFDRYLREEAVRRGVELLDGAVRRVQRCRDGHEIHHRGGEKLVSRFVVDASGRAGVLARRYRRREKAFRTLALTGHFRTEEKEPPTLVEAFDDGWVWSAPLRNGLRDVTAMLDARATGRDRREIYRDAVEAAGHVRSIVASARRVGPVRGIDATSYTASRFCDRDLLLVGDAATVVDPLSAHGVHKAMDGALMAAAVARTILERPAMAEDAARFYDEHESRIYRVMRVRLAGLYRQESRFVDRPFWAERGTFEAPATRAPDPPKAPLVSTAKLRAGVGVEIVHTPVLENDYVERREVLVRPGAERPVRFLGTLSLPELFRGALRAESASAAARSAAASFERAYEAIDWMVRFGYLDPEGPP